MTTQADPNTPAASPRKGRKSGIVNELSVFLKVKPGHEKQIREVFTTGDADPEQPTRFKEELNSVGTLHEARMVLFDNDTRLLIATSFDGDWDVYIEDFARTGVLQTWEQILVHCEGYPDAADLASQTLYPKKEYLGTHQITAAMYNRLYPAVTAKEILKALRVQTVFQQLLDEASS